MGAGEGVAVTSTDGEGLGPAAWTGPCPPGRLSHHRSRAVRQSIRAAIRDLGGEERGGWEWEREEREERGEGWEAPWEEEREGAREEACEAEREEAWEE